MSRRLRSLRVPMHLNRKITTLTIASLSGLAAGAAGETLVFTDAFEMKIQNDGLPSVIGSDVQNYFIDGGNPVTGDATTGPGDTAHSYDFLRFENLFGAGAGQIPAGATILGASLQISTAVRGNAQSNGPFGVAPLLAPFAASNTYADYSGPYTGYNAGPSYLNGHVGRPAGGFSGMTTQGSRVSADVTLLLQQWNTAPSTAFGFAITSRTTDAWGIETVGSATMENRPSLTVEYTTAPTNTYRFQEGVNGYVGTTMSLISQTGSVQDGAGMNAAYLDGPNGTDSFDVQALLKFDNIFGDMEGQLKPTEKILRAYLVFTTATAGESQSNGVFDVHQMLKGWDTTSDFASFGGDGPTVEQGEISDILSSAWGMIHGSQALFDVTSAVQAWQGGADNFGLNIQASTTDGWQIHWSGAPDVSVRPELVIITESVPEPGTGALLGIAGVGLLGFRRRWNHPIADQRTKSD